MYSNSAQRIYNPRPDPMEQGPPKRISREETHIGEIVAASKKRIAWRFALGESDTQHEVVVTHSIMSYKKVVEFDGRQMHYSATAAPGDWSFTMILDGSNHVFEVRINDVETMDTPKYDLAVERVPFRRWDVYRRRKQPITTATYAQPNAAPTNAFGTQRWGPGGMTAQQPAGYGRTSEGGGRSSESGGRYSDNGGRYSETGGRYSENGGRYSETGGRYSENGGRYSENGGRNSENGGRMSEGRSSRSSSFGAGTTTQRQSFTGPSYHQPQQASAPTQPAHAPAAPPAQVQKKQPDINLIDDFGPSVTVSAQALLFDPLASSKIAGSAPTAAPVQQQQQQQQQLRTSSSPALGNAFGAPSSATYVDPFAGVSQTAPLKPVPAPINLDPFAPAANAYAQPMRQPLAQLPMGYQQPNAPMAYQQSNASMAYQQQQQQQPGMGAPMGMRGMAQQQQTMPMASQPVRTNGVNYNISQMMNPADFNQGQQAPQGAKSINIDAFAAMRS